jgi:hypothetical protein
MGKRADERFRDDACSRYAQHELVAGSATACAAARWIGSANTSNCQRSKRNAASIHIVIAEDLAL